MNAAQSWQELHEKLSEIGMKFERKGSGAVVVVNDEIVKASNVGRDCSLSKLEKRLGEFVERDSADSARDVPVPQPPEPTKRTETTEKTLSAWKRYQIYREDYLAQKEKRNVAFTQRKFEWDELKKRHKTERDRLYNTNWKGRGAELNQERRIIAATQLQDRMRLKAKHDDDIKVLEPSQKFLSYRKWLAGTQPELISDLRNWRENERKKEELFQTPVLQIYNSDTRNEHEKSEPSLKNFAAYRIWKHSDGKTLSYRLKGEKTAFVERKDEITVFQNTESSLLAAMLLAQSKWGTIKLEGTKKNLDICVRLAKEHGIRIQMPKEYLETLEVPKDEIYHEHTYEKVHPIRKKTSESCDMGR